MTWKERRTVTILSIILAVLAAALLVVLGIRYREHRAADGAVQQTGAIAPAAAYTAVTCSNSTATLSFSLDETGRWIWSDDPDFPLRQDAVPAILEALAALTPQQVLSDPEDPETYGLDDPTASITASGEGVAEISLVFGKATTDGESYYAVMNGDESVLYIFDGALQTALQTPIYDMCDLPDLPDLTEETLASVVIQGTPAGETPGPVTTLNAQRAEDGGDAAWRCDGVNVTDNPTVQALLEDLENWMLARCVDYRPSDEAADICGFSAPDASVTITYSTEGGTDQTLVLTVGKAPADGEGRYVRVGEDTTIYLMETALMDPLMRLAANGLE